MSYMMLNPSIYAAMGSLLLDQVSGAVSAVSVRKLRAAYAGAALRIRESGGNTELDIGFSGADLDTASLLTFVGANDGFVVKMYDQVGTGVTVYFDQATAANQPKLVSSGSLLTTLGGKPSPTYDGTNDSLLGGNVSSNFIAADNGTVCVVFRTSAIDTNGSPIYNNDAVFASTDGIWGVVLKSAPTAHSFNDDLAVDSTSKSIAVNTDYVHTWQHGSGTLSGFTNSATAQTASSGSTKSLTSNPKLGSMQFLPAFMAGVICEIIFWTTTLNSTNLGIVQDNMGAYYGITIGV